MAKKNRQFWETCKDNNLTYQQYYNRLTEMALAMFEWVNLPPSVDPRFLELALLTDGMALFFKDENMEDNKQYLCLRTMIGGNLNVYDIPTRRTAYASNGYNAVRDETNSVLIFNNYLHTNSLLDIDMYAKRLAEIDRTIDINVKAQKTPIIIQCAENQRLTMKNLYMKYEGNEPYIFADKSLNSEPLRVLNTGAPLVATPLYDLRQKIWNDGLTSLGIENVNVEKKERLLTNEIIKGQGGTMATRQSKLEARREGCRQINKMYGLDTWCNFRKGFIENAESIENAEVGEYDE